MRVVKNERGAIGAEVMLQAHLVHAATLAIESAKDARAFQEALDAELKATGVRRVLIDARRAPISTPEMNESMWTWVKNSPNFDQLAIVNQSPRLNVAVSMKARSLGTKKVQVFQDIPSAARWLATRPKEDKGKPKDEPTTGTAKRSAG